MRAREREETARYRKPARSDAPLSISVSLSLLVLSTSSFCTFTGVVIISRAREHLVRERDFLF